MSLHVQVGTLTAYFAPALREEAVLQGDPVPDDASVQARIEAWRAWLSDGLERAGHLARPLVWDESDANPPECTTIDARALQALKLWLAYDGHGRAPDEMPARPELDPRWTELAASNFADSAWDQILVPEFWLPGEAPFTFGCPYPDGHEVQAGWVTTIVGQLAALHERKFGATPFEARLAASTETAGAPDVTTLARHAAGVLAGMAARAAARKLPMLIYAL